MQTGAPSFDRYLGIDYSGASAPTSALKGLRAYRAGRNGPPEEVLPPSGARRYWTRRGLAEWLLSCLQEPVPTLVGIDHGFSFPLQYFRKYELAQDWSVFLDDFQCHWPTDGDDVCVEFIRDGLQGRGAERTGSARWRRVTEERAGGAKSVFHFDVPGSVAKSTHAGLPWLRFLRRQLGESVHFWPFDGWIVPPGRSAMAEVYPSLWKQAWPAEERTADQHDAYCVAAWLREADATGRLDEFLNPELKAPERATAGVEGWILGVS